MAINYWLIKSEPSTYSIDQLKIDKQTMWNGVRNYAARNNLQAMKKGDVCLFYHSVVDPAIVGLAKVVKEAYPDPTTEEKAWVVVDVAFMKKFKQAIPLPQIKVDAHLAGMDLLRLSRLSVQSVKPDEYGYILSLAGEG
jgi:predicted RNA-binding protein with PUA-like domain